MILATTAGFALKNNKKQTRKIKIKDFRTHHGIYSKHVKKSPNCTVFPYHLLPH